MSARRSSARLPVRRPIGRIRCSRAVAGAARLLAAGWNTDVFGAIERGGGAVVRFTAPESAMLWRRFRSSTRPSAPRREQHFAEFEASRGPSSPLIMEVPVEQTEAPYARAAGPDWGLLGGLPPFSSCSGRAPVLSTPCRLDRADLRLDCDRCSRGPRVAAIGALSQRLRSVRARTARRSTRWSSRRRRMRRCRLSRARSTSAWFQALAVRIAGLIRGDRVGLALLTETGQESKHSRHASRRTSGAPAASRRRLSGRHTAIGLLVRSLEPLLITASGRPTPTARRHVLVSAGFKSALGCRSSPRGGVGTLNLVSRTPRAFVQEESTRCARSPRSSPSRTSLSSWTCSSANTARSRRCPT